MDERPDDRPRGRVRDLPVVSAPPWWRLVLTLGGAGVLAGLLIVLVFQVTQPRIRAYKAQVLRDAVQEVLKSPYRYDTLYVYQGGLTAELPATADAQALEQVYVGYTESGDRIGYAITGAQPGFQDVIRLIFGYDPATGELLGMKVLESKETPGLGDKIEKDPDFVAGFAGVEPPLLGVKTGAGDDPHEVDMITGATISSRTVIRIINDQVARMDPLLRAYAGAYRE